MKRGLCCLCAALLCTALVMADTPTKSVVPAPGNVIPHKVSNSAYVSDDGATFVGPLQPTQSGTQRRFSPTNQAPEGYEGPKYTGSAGIRIDCPGSVAEGEPICSDEYDDVYNGGCNSTPPIFQTIACDAIILGESGTFLYAGGSYRDTDWYEVTVTDNTEFFWNVTADFSVLIFLIQNNTGIPGDCSDYTVLRSATAAAGVEASVSKCCYPGTYWVWAGPSVFTGVPCGSQYCAELICEPCTPPPPTACPEEDTLTGQAAYGEEEAWSVYVSNDRFPTGNPADGIKLYENFCGAGGPINDVHWWGLSMIYNDEGILEECLLDPGNFVIEFYDTDPLTNRPNYTLGALATYNANAGTGLTKTDTGHVYEIYIWQFDITVPMTLWYWTFDLPTPWTDFEGWVSIKNTDYCWFWWAGSPEGGTIHVTEDEATTVRTDEDGDLAYCLTGLNIGPFTGACCDESEGVCRDTTADDCCGPYERWEAGLACASITCQAELWACCIGPLCNMMTSGNCGTSAGYWFEGFVCTTTDPKYTGDNLADCSDFEPPPGITCDPGFCAGFNVTGGYLYISWDRGVGDQRFVIDNYAGCTQPIVRVYFWGNSADVWAGPDYDPPAEAPFVIKFYPDNAGAPNVGAPSCVYNPIYCSWAETQYYWTGSPELGMIERYVAYLAPSCNLPAGWISIAGADPDTTHDFIWAPSTAGDGVMYFYDNGVLTLEPAGRGRSFCLYTDVRTGACCYMETGTCVNGEQEDICLAQPATYFKANKTCASLVPPCAACEGACCNTVTDECYVEDYTTCTARGVPWEWLGCGSTCDDCCVVVCPGGGTAEGEPTCYDGYVDTYNYGCFTSPSWVFPDDWLQITDGQTYCGESGTYTTGLDTLRDFDWYYYVLTDDVALVEAHVYAEFEADVYLMIPDPNDEGDGYCPAYYFSEGYAVPCEDAIASGAITAGTYYVAVSCFGLLDCGTPYLLWIEKSLAGKCEIDPDICVDRSEIVCLAMGGTWTAGVPCPAPRPCLDTGDANCDGLINTFDIDPFVLALTGGQVAWEAAYTCDFLCACDCDGSGAVNTFDIDPFVAILTGK